MEPIIHLLRIRAKSKVRSKFKKMFDKWHNWPGFGQPGSRSEKIILDCFAWINDVKNERKEKINDNLI